MAAADPSMPTQVVLCLPVLRGLNGAQVLLGLKRHGFGAGRVVAPGGKIEPGEAPAEAAARELREETAVMTDSDSLEPAARVYFRFPYAPATDMDCTVFLARDFTGPAKATDELEPAWYPLGHLPLERMWDDSALWLGLLLSGERFDAVVVLAEDNESVARFSKVDWPDSKMPSQPATNADFPDITQ
ncbi:8-oxo-dGTP diphosphatase [Paeniglutamicibacter kerguelensis]|uniref:Oxidized purine nucleoside triphosphate hydrolase n=1 Tax=Paeniglutamicibacter kerguelensis TaxID=254788 RepID=A0ABS4XA01_9MICC|nr:NUDIX domain-containing protein [Paeniglutamicibacter kerguelensis]MBP2385296.1 8-oxo-dGTP diphosphatase [Paeniglutamicibacter kerguelensis]